MNLNEIEYPLRLCVELMHYAALGAGGKTDDRTASEIKNDVGRFFTNEQIEKAMEILTGTHNAPSYPTKGTGDKLGYHDVEIEYKGVRSRLFDSPYNITLTCTRTGGWELWAHWNGEEINLASEYGEPRLKVYIKGVCICGEKDLVIFDEPKNGYPIFQV